MGAFIASFLQFNYGNWIQSSMDGFWYSSYISICCVSLTLILFTYRSKYLRGILEQGALQMQRFLLNSEGLVGAQLGMKFHCFLLLQVL